MRRTALGAICAATLLNGCGSTITEPDEPALIVDISSHEQLLAATAPTVEDYGVLVLDWNVQADLPAWDDAAQYELVIFDKDTINTFMSSLGLDDTGDDQFEGPGGHGSVDTLAGTFRWTPSEDQATRSAEELIGEIAELGGWDLFTIRPASRTRWVGDLQVNGVRVVGASIEAEIGADGAVSVLTGPLWHPNKLEQVPVADIDTLTDRLQTTFGTTEPAQPSVNTSDPQIGTEEPGEVPWWDEPTADLEQVELEGVTGSCDLGDLTCEDPWTIQRTVLGFEPVLVIGTELSDPETPGELPSRGREQAVWYLTPGWAVAMDGTGVLPGDPVIAATV